MPTRVFAFLLTFVLLWSGFIQPDQAAVASMHNIEQAVDLTLGNVEHRCPAEPIDDRQADELPAQLHAEGAQDPLLLKDMWVVPELALTLERPHRFGLAARGAPFLEAPQRPPCSFSSHA